MIVMWNKLTTQLRRVITALAVSTAVLLPTAGVVPLAVADLPNDTPFGSYYQPDVFPPVATDNPTHWDEDCAQGDSPDLASGCPQYRGLDQLNPVKYEEERQDCGCILIVLCRLTDTLVDWDIVVADDGEVISETKTTTCKYEKCGESYDLPPEILH